MNPTITSQTPPLLLPDADRVGVAASILCAIHCGLAPVLLLFLPAFGRIWAHPASHALVAILIVPLAIFSIWRGYRRHRRRSVLLLAASGIFGVLIGAGLPAFGKEPAGNPAAIPVATNLETIEVSKADAETSACQDDCCLTAGATTPPTFLSVAAIAAPESIPQAAACVDQCCPSAQISETGEVSLHIPPAAIVTTLGGIFLIGAHSLNLCACRKCGLSCES